MKFLIPEIMLSLLLTTSALAKDNVIIALNQQGILGVTATILLKGINLAFKNLSDKNKNEYEIITVQVDDNLDNIFKKLEAEIIKKRPIAIIGGISSNQAFLLNAVSRKHSIPFVTPLATHPDVTSSNPYTVRVCFDDRLQTSKLAEFIYKSQGKKKGLVLYSEKQSYAIGVKKNFLDEFRKFQGTSVTALEFTNVEDIKKSLLKEIKRNAPEFILLPSYQTEAANIISILAEQLPSTKFYGTDSWGGGRLFHSIISSSPLQIEGFYVQHWSPNYNKKLNDKFISQTKKDEFLSKYESVAMLAPAAIGSDALNFVIRANEAAKINKTDLLQSLKSTKYEGLTGPIDLKGGQTPSKVLFVYRIYNDGEQFYASYP
jgi:branched-chain amino acid transport system substrate-binding protein